MRRVLRLLDDSIASPLRPRTPPLCPSCRAQEGALSRRRRTYIRVYHLHYSPRFLKCPGYDSAYATQSQRWSGCAHRKSFRIAVDVLRG